MKQLSREQLQSHVLSNYWRNMDVDYAQRQVNGMELPKGYSEFLNNKKERSIAKQKA